MNPRVYPLLAASSSLTAMVGDRITPVKAEQDSVRPYVVFTPVGLSGEQYFAAPDDVDYDRVQIDCYAESFGQAENIAAAVRAALQGNGYIASSFDDYEPETRLFRISLDWSFVTLS